MMKPFAKRFVLFLFVCFCLPASCATICGDSEQAPGEKYSFMRRLREACD